MSRLADVLLERRILSAEQLEAVQAARAAGQTLGGCAIAQGLATERQLLELLAFGDSIEDFVPEGLSRELAELLPADTALPLRCVPVYDNGQVLSVAFANEVDDLAIERLSARTQRQIQAFLADTATLEAAQAALYGPPPGEGPPEGEAAAPPEPGAEPEAELESLDLAGGPPAEAEAEGEAEAAEDGSSVPEIADFKGVMSEAIGEVQIVQENAQETANAYGIEIEANSPPIVKLVNGLLIKALNLRASDIHIEPQERELVVRFRIDGELHKVMKLPKGVSHKITSRIKIMATLDITNRRIPQDGRFKVQLGPGRVVEFRLSTLPSVCGEKIVMRVLGGNKLKGDVASLGFNPRDYECVESTLKSPWGMILVTGPTGSGKTTTLYTMLKTLNTPNRNVMTAEDPVEYSLPGITQTPINPAVEMTFEKALRAFLRQDPDVILVGEIRDRETAEIAAKAAMTGHMVLSTLHTNDAPSTVLRLKNTGVEPFLIVSALKLVIAQRLVRLLCPSCKIPVPLSDEDKIGLKPAEIARLARVFRGKGCGECGGIGYKGRRPVFEVMPIASEAMKKSILDNDALALEGIARYEGMKSLRENAVDLAAEGVISFQEALKVGFAAV